MLRSVSIMILVLLLIGSGAAQDDAKTSNTLTCSFSVPVSAACFYERAAFTLWNLELAYGIDTRLYPDPYLAPFLVLGWYESNYAVIAELFMPELQGVPAIGRPGTVFSVTTIYRW